MKTRSAVNSDVFAGVYDTCLYRLNATQGLTELLLLLLFVAHDTNNLKTKKKTILCNQNPVVIILREPSDDKWRRIDYESESSVNETKI